MICHQRKIREAQALTDPRPVMDNLDGVVVRQITREEAEAIIYQYEWLGTMPTVARAYYGMVTPDGEIIGACCFGVGGGSNARNICGPENRDVTICLERGACVHWAHPHAGSKLVAQACKLAHKEFGWKIFYAYSDEHAGEIGTIYQACNWRYLGRGVGRGNGNTSRSVFYDPNGKKITSKSMRAYVRREMNCTIADAWPLLEFFGWTRDREMDKHKYATVVCRHDGEKKALLALLPNLPYPKRP